MRTLRLLTVVGAFALSVATAHAAQVGISISIGGPRGYYPPPPPRPVAVVYAQPVPVGYAPPPPPRPGYFWVEGCRRGAYWVPGHWEVAQPGYGYGPGPGYWRERGHHRGW